MKWIIKNWAKVGIILAFYLTLFLVVFMREIGLDLFLILILTPLYMLHETEEYVFPGGFKRFINKDIFNFDTEEKPMDDNFIFAINIGFIWILLPVFGLLSKISLNFGLWIPYFTIIAGVAHIGLAIKAHKIYNPGLIISLTLNIPVGLAVVNYFFNTGVISNPILNIHLPIGLGVNLLLPVLAKIIFNKHLKSI